MLTKQEKTKQELVTNTPSKLNLHKRDSKTKITSPQTKRKAGELWTTELQNQPKRGKYQENIQEFPSANASKICQKVTAA